MEWTDTALVLHVGRFRESDMWVRLLSRHRGIFNVFAFGGSRSRKRFCGCLDLLNTLTCRVKSTKNGTYLSLEEGVLLHGPQRLRKDWSRLGLAMNCVRFLDVLGVTRDAAPDSFALIMDSLNFLEESTQPHTIFPLFFRLRLASEQGFAPSFCRCAKCGKGVQNALFLMNEGQVLCSHCKCEHKHNLYAVELSFSSLAVLRQVQKEPPEHWQNVVLSPQDRRDCAKAIDGFVQYHLGIAWEEGRFRRV